MESIIEFFLLVINNPLKDSTLITESLEICIYRTETE